MVLAMRWAQQEQESLSAKGILPAQQKYAHEAQHLEQKQWEMRVLPRELRLVLQPGLTGLALPWHLLDLMAWRHVGMEPL